MKYWFVDLSMNNVDKFILSVLLVIVALFSGVVYVGILNPHQIIGSNFGVAEQLRIINIDFNSNNVATVEIKNYASTTATIVSAQINGQSASLKSSGEPAAIIPKGSSANLTISFKDRSQFSLGEEYQFKLVTTRGTSFCYTAIYNPTP